MGKQARARRNARPAPLRRVAALGGLVILALVAAIVVALVRAAGDDPPSVNQAATAATSAPAGATGKGAIAIGRDSAPVTVTLYLDYMCPYCGRFERANGADLQRLAADGSIRIELHPLAFLDRASRGSRYSTRAANAVATVADRAPQQLLAFSNALYARQPAENTTGLTDEQIAAVATSAGVPGDVAGAFTRGGFEAWIAAGTEAAFNRDGITGTPTVLINGTPFKGDLYTAGPLAAAVDAARGHG